MLKAATLLLLAAAVSAGDETISIPLQHLKLEGALAEGPRQLGDVFPYIEIGGADLTVDTFRAKVDSAGAAIEAVRLFAAGPLVRDKETAETMIATGKLLAEKLKYLDVKRLDHRPKTYEPTAVKTKDGWRVSLVAFEMDRMLGLVHFEAEVSPEGKVKLTRKPIVDGPMTTWQTAIMADATPEQHDAAAKQERAMQQEALLARRIYAKALAPACDLDTAWAIARLRLSVVQIEDLWGRYDRVVGSGALLVARDLKDGGAIIYDAGYGERPVPRMSHVAAAPGPMRIGPLLHQLSR